MTETDELDEMEIETIAAAASAPYGEDDCEDEHQIDECGDYSSTDVQQPHHQQHHHYRSGSGCLVMISAALSLLVTSVMLLVLVFFTRSAFADNILNQAAGVARERNKRTVVNKDKFFQPSISDFILIASFIKLKTMFGVFV